MSMGTPGWNPGAEAARRANDQTMRDQQEAMRIQRMNSFNQPPQPAYRGRGGSKWPLLIVVVLLVVCAVVVFQQVQSWTSSDSGSDPTPCNNLAAPSSDCLP